MSITGIRCVPALNGLVCIVIDGTTKLVSEQTARFLSAALITAGYGPGNADDAALNAAWKRPPSLHHWLGAEVG